MSIEKGGRPRDWLWDSLLHDTVEEWRARGLTLDEAYHQTAQDFKLITGTNRHGNKGGDAETTVKSACLRWIARTDPVKRSEMPRGGENAWEPWTREIKPEWIEKDRDAKALAEGREPRRDKFNNWYMKQPLTNEEYEEEVRTELGLQQIMGFDKHLRPVLYPRAKNK
jgi:hypothetical protein